MNFEDLKGKVFTEVRVLKGSGDDRITFVDTDEVEYAMYHSQDCCESVDIDDICGEVDDLVGSPIILAEKVTNGGNDSGMSDWPKGIKKPEYTPDSYTWTFYKLSTVKGSVTIRWYGSSNGYYSESVCFEKVA